MRTLFFGNHTVGVIALEALIAETDVQGVVAHPPDPEDGVRYRSVYDHARQCGLPVIRGEARTQDVQTFVMDRDIDLLTKVYTRNFACEFHPAFKSFSIFILIQVPTILHIMRMTLSELEWLPGKKPTWTTGNN